MTEQKPINSGFGAANTAEDVIKGIDLTGKTAIVTGGYSGLGLESVRVLRNAGAQVIVPTRDVERARKALAGIEGLDGVAIEAMDLMDSASIDAFAGKFIASGRALNILMNSAGIMANPLTRDARGYESQFSTNHLGHFQLTARLWPALKKADGARVVAVSSWGHHRSPVVFDDWNFEHREYEPFLGYGQSKTANILFALQLDKLGKEFNVRAFSLHPGAIVDTNLGTHLPIERLRDLNVVDENDQPIHDPARGLKNVHEGASTQIWCAVSPQLDGMGGVYCENNNIAAIDTTPEGESAVSSAFSNGGVMPYAIDPAAAQQLWALSEQLTGVKFELSQAAGQD